MEVTPTAQRIPDSFSTFQVAEDVRAIAGGVPAVVRQLSNQLASVGVGVSVICALNDGVDVGVGIREKEIPPSAIGRPWAWNPSLRSDIAEFVEDVRAHQGVVHIHGIWAAPQYFAARCAHQAGVPFILSAHGMLEPWLWNEQGLLKSVKKKVYWRSFAYPAFRHAAAIHAITEIEKNNLRKLFPGNDIQVIPNATLMSSPPLRDTLIPKKRISFLGRIDPKKGVDILIDAFNLAGLGSEWSLDIVGPSWSDSYMTSLKNQVSKLGLQNKVRFVDPLFASEKEAFIKESWVVAVPSHSEAIGLVNLESATLGVPTITTPQTGLFDWEAGGGVLAEPNPQAIAGALKLAVKWTAEEREKRGKALQDLIRVRYSWEAVLPLWLRLYQSLA